MGQTVNPTAVRWLVSGFNREVDIQWELCSCSDPSHHRVSSSYCYWCWKWYFTSRSRSAGRCYWCLHFWCWCRPPDPIRKGPLRVHGPHFRNQSATKINHRFRHICVAGGWSNCGIKTLRVLGGCKKKKVKTQTDNAPHLQLHLG